MAPMGFRGAPVALRGVSVGFKGPFRGGDGVSGAFQRSPSGFQERLREVQGVPEISAAFQAVQVGFKGVPEISMAFQGVFIKLQRNPMGFRGISDVPKRCSRSSLGLFKGSQGFLGKFQSILEAFQGHFREFKEVAGDLRGVQGRVIGFQEYNEVSRTIKENPGAQAGYRV